MRPGLLIPRDESFSDRELASLYREQKKYQRCRPQERTDAASWDQNEAAGTRIISVSRCPRSIIEK